MKKYKFIDLFAGCGGLEDGFLQSGRYIDIAAVEWLKPQVNTLIRRLETKWKVEDAAERVMHFDIQRETELFAGWDDEKFGSGKGLDYFVNKAQGIDVIIGGPPCQAWDNMEATLQREDMWRFLTGSGKFSSIDTHMELIFQIMANEIIKSRVEKYPEFYIENEKQLNRETYTFIIFNREIEYMKREYVDVGDYKYSKMLEDFWGKVESFYNMFIDWYEDREWYHLIGVLLSKDENQSEEYFENLCNLYRGHTKTEFVMELKKKIISEIEFEDTDKDDFEFGEEVVREYLNSLQYSGKKAEKNKIKNMLLLFNVISMQQNTDSNPRFPFDAYQRQKWDIEHIHSVTTDRAQNKKEREEWLEEAKPYIDSEVGMPEDLKAEIDNIYTKKLYEDESAPQYDEMYNKVIAFFSGESSVEEKPINEISNLTLLDQRTNRGYGNHIFPVKRNKILEKSGIESFIPLCTKNVFLKFYSKTVSQMYLWDKHDRQDYFDKMVQTIVDYLAEDIEDMKEEI